MNLAPIGWALVAWASLAACSGPEASPGAIVVPAAAISAGAAALRSSPQPQQLPSVQFMAEVGGDPFNPLRLYIASGSERSRPHAYQHLVAAEQQRIKQALEHYPLDAMRVVGVMQRNGRHTALLQVDKQLHAVQTGDYLGPHYGRVQAIDGQSIQLREMVQEMGEMWVERLAVLRLEGTANP